MGKHDNEKKKGFDCLDDITSLREAQKEITKKIEKAKIPCSHTNENGKIKIRFIREGSTEVQCKRCNEIFDFKTISMDKLNDAIETIHDAINQVKALSDRPEEERKVIRRLGELDYDLKNFPDIYEGATSSFGKNKNKKKKKKNNYNSIGAFGASNVSYLK